MMIAPPGSSPLSPAPPAGQPAHGEIAYTIYTHSAATSVFLNKLFIILYVFIPLARALVDVIG